MKTYKNIFFMLKGFAYQTINGILHGLLKHNNKIGYFYNSQRKGFWITENKL